MSLIKILGQIKFMQPTREQVATKAYLTLLKSKGVDSVTLRLRKAILNDLSALLAGKVLDGGGYRLVVEKFLENTPPEDWPFALATAREYFHFWMDDIDGIVNQNTRKAYVNEIGWLPEATSMEALTEELKVQKFDSAEMWPLKSYKQALKNAGAGKPLVDARAKFAKMAMLRLRQSPIKNHQAYRVVVDSTLPLFRMKNSRKLFLEVVREFYHFWSGNPEAEQFVLQS